MVIISEIAENNSNVEETPLSSINNRPEHVPFGEQNSLAIVLATNFSGITHRLVPRPEMVRHLNFSPSSSVSLKHLARTQRQDHGSAAEMRAILPCVPKILEGDHSNTGLLDFLSTTLKAEMKLYVSELKHSTAMEASPKIPKDVINVAPLSSFRIPDGSQNDEQTYSLSAQKRRVPTTCLGESVFSFTYPRLFVSDDKQVDDLIASETGRQYTFSERLEGWKIERRQRINGRFDLYYYHLKSQSTFRSTIEVLNFLLHETRRDRRQSSGKEIADESDADSSQRSEGAIKRKRWSSSDAESSRKMTQIIEDSRVEMLRIESRENLSPIPNPPRVYPSERELYRMTPEERREEVERFLMDSHHNMEKSKHWRSRNEELKSQEVDKDIPRQEEKEEHLKNEIASPFEKAVAENDKDSDDETVSDILAEEEEDIILEDPVPEKKEAAIGVEENSKEADADAVADAEIDEAFMDIEKAPMEDTFMMMGSSSYCPPYSFEDYDLIYSPPHSALMDPHAYLPPFRRKDGGL